MESQQGYRVGIDGPGGLAAFVALLRRDALRVFTRLYGVLLADEVAARVDGHRCGLRPGDRDSSPLRDAVLALRMAHAGAEPGSALAALDLRLRLLPDATGLVVLFEGGHPDYAVALAGIEGMRDIAMPGDRPASVDEEEWADRARAWEIVRAAPPMGRGLGFSLVDGRLPSLRHAALRRGFPDFEARCRRTAEAIVIDRGEAGVPAREALGREVRRLRRLLPPEIGEADLAGYPAPKPARRPREVPPSPAHRGLIDHADVIEAADGRIFVAVPEAGLDPGERVHLQIADRYLSFVQGTTHFGGVTDVPYAAIDLLRRCREAYVVEVRMVDGRRSVRARHEAFVRDDTLASVFKAGLAAFRGAAVRGRRKANVEWMDG